MEARFSPRTKRLLHTSVLLLPVLGFGCVGEEPGPDSGAEAESSGRLVIIGGGLQAENSAVYQAILDGRSGDGPVCVFPTASAEPRESMQSAVARIEAVGGPGTAQGIFLTVDNPEEAASPSTVEKIQACDGFYFSGGVQTRIVEVFRPADGDTPSFHALMSRFESGAPVSGSSAGAAIMSDPMIGGGSSVGALTSGIRAQENGEGVILEKGLGFLENTLVDQHFLARGRWARLLVAALETEAYTFGAGIDENTALVVQGDSAWVVGESGVVFFDTRNAVAGEGDRNVSGIEVFLLGSGDGLDLISGEIHLDPAKSRIPESGEAPAMEKLDLFERWGFLRFFARSASVSDTVFTFRQDGFAFEILKGPGYRAVSAAGEGVEGTPRGLAAGPLILSLRPSPES